MYDLEIGISPEVIDNNSTTKIITKSSPEKNIPGSDLRRSLNTKKKPITGSKIPIINRL
jgi:hypothetical protein